MKLDIIYFFGIVIMVQFENNPTMFSHPVHNWESVFPEDIVTPADATEFNGWLGPYTFAAVGHFAYNC
jgi:hypothetical protein